MGRFLIWLSGAQRDILDDCRTDRAKYVGIGSAVLVTSSMAAVSMSFALHIALKASVPVAIPFALAWGLAIMSLDRWLVVSMSRHQLWLALPRVLLGLLFGIIISTPLTLQIFHVEIANQISLDQATAASNFESSLKSNQLYLKVQKDQQAVVADQSVINSGGGSGESPADDSNLVQLNSQLKSDQADQAKYLAALKCEEGDPPSKTCTAGEGPAFDRDKQNYEIYTQRVQNDLTQIANAEQALKTKNQSDEASALANARSNLKIDQATLSLDKKALTTVENSFNSSNAANSGILASLKALEELRGKDATLFWAEFLLFLFFTSIECLPIGVKVLLNLGPMNSYEKAIIKAEEFGLRCAEDSMVSQYMRLSQERERAFMESERVQRLWEFEELDRLAREEVEAGKRVAMGRLRHWEQRAKTRPDYNESDDRFGPGHLSDFSRPGPDYTNVRNRRKLRRRVRVRDRIRAFRDAGMPRPPTQAHPAHQPGFPQNVRPITPAAGNHWPYV